MKKYLILFALSLLAPITKAQLMTYLSVEGGPQWSLVRVADQGGYFQRANVKSSMAGITVGQEIVPNLSVVTGIYYQLYRDGINMKDDRPHQTRWEAYNAILIPLRAHYRVQLSEFPVSFTPRMGYVFGVVSQPEIHYQTSGILSAPNGTAYSFNLDHTYSGSSLHMLETGVSVDLRFFESWQASLNLSYLTGFTEPLSMEMDYTSLGSGTNTATYSTKGNTIYSTLSFHIPVSTIWQNKDYRIRARIENSVYEGKPLDKRGEFYVGGEVGSLWRQFNTTNPAIGDRPMEGKGLFRYANLHTGLYVGYMLTEELGADIGVLYQRSSTFYALMYDHEVDFVTKAPAPLFLEVPLRIRYLYNVYKDKIHYAVYGGASLLTHFAGAGYNAGGGGFSLNSPETGGQINGNTSYEASRIAKFSPVMRIGSGVEYLLPVPFPLVATLYLNYMHGFVTNDAIEVTNTLPGETNGGGIHYNGSGWSVDVGVKYPFKFGGKVRCGKPIEKPE